MTKPHGEYNAENVRKFMEEKMAKRLEEFVLTTAPLLPNKDRVIKFIMRHYEELGRIIGFSDNFSTACIEYQQQQARNAKRKNKKALDFLPCL